MTAPNLTPTSTAAPERELRYVSEAYPHTHPDRLAALAKLFGMTPPPLDSCRVLELACASGGNLVPMAAAMPGASFVGIDVSAPQITDGSAAIAALGLANIELRAMDLGDVDAPLGRFDYIIAHGVYSWVSAELREKILAICRDHLAPEGVAYVSYNTNPGWRMRGMIRDMMIYHASRFADLKSRVQQARALLDFLAQNVPTENNPYGILLKQEVERLRKERDSYLAYEHLADINEPVYFHQFADAAARHGLQYLGESEFHTMLASNFPPEVSETLARIAPDIVRMEQYMDFVRNRDFRATLLVHEGVRLNRNLDWRSVQGLHVASASRPVSAQPDLRSAAVETFGGPTGMYLKTPYPITKAAMVILAERWPQAMPVADLCAAARRRLEVGPVAAPDAAAAADDAQTLGADLLRCLSAGLVELHAMAPRFAVMAGDRPRAIPVARLQAEKGLRVTNARHETLNIDEFMRQLLRHLDGTRDRAALLDVLADLAAQGQLTIREKDKLVTKPETIREIVGLALDQNLPKLAGAALLEA